MTNGHTANSTGPSIEGNQFYGRDPYGEFVRSEGLPVYEAFSVDCLALELEPWARLGGRGAYVHLPGRGDFTSVYVAEIPPAGELKPERHLHDEYVYVLAGHGSTSIELPSGARHTFEWGPDSIFGIPLNVPHQHFNGSGTEPARFAAATNLPIAINLFHDVDFIYDNPWTFKDRIGEERYFRGDGEFRFVRPGRHQWETNFVPDVAGFALREWKERGAGGTNVQFVLADSTMHAHTSEFPTGTYKKAHRHPAGAHIFPVTGHGYSLLWNEGEDPTAAIRIDWQRGTLFAPPDDLFHQHFNTAGDPARYLVFGFAGGRYPTVSSWRATMEDMDKSTKHGGLQIEYEDEHPGVLELFEHELAKRGVQSRMREIVGSSR